jgi:pimeloyl-ACP methyl ester carboxylesterase
MSAAVKSSTFDLHSADGVRLRADVWGNTPISVLFLHGGGQTRHAWNSTCIRLAAAGFGSQSLDLRGHGESDWDPSGDYEMDDLVGDVVSALRDIGHPVVLVGASLGGVLGLLAVEKRPVPMPAGLVLIDVTPTIEPAGEERIRTFMASAPDGFATLDEAAERIAQYLPHRPRPPSPAGLRKNLTQHEDGRWRWRWDPQFLANFVPRGTERRQRMIAAARTLDIPTLLVRGRLSDVVADGGVEEFRQLAPTAEYVNVADATHMVAGDENDAFTEAIADFVRRVQPPD